MGIVLLEPSDSCQPRQGTFELVSVQNPEISHSDWQVSVRSLVKIEHYAVTRTVHWLQSVLFSFIIDEKDVFFVFEVMTTLHP